MSAKKLPLIPFNVALGRERAREYHPASVVAGPAGVTLAIYNHIELGHHPVSPAYS